MYLMVLECGKDNIKCSGRIYTCIAHGSVNDDKICPKNHNKYFFEFDCWAVEQT